MICSACNKEIPNEEIYSVGTFVPVATQITIMSKKMKSKPKATHPWKKPFSWNEAQAQKAVKKELDKIKKKNEAI